MERFKNGFMDGMNLWLAILKPNFDGYNIGYFLAFFVGIFLIVCLVTILFLGTIYIVVVS